MTLIAETVTARTLRRVAASAFDEYRGRKPLHAFVSQPIRAGRVGGLPYDALTTDVINGCLPAASVCYGSCFAARSAFEAGFDFGQRVRNRVDRDLLQADLDGLPSTQGHLRNGWNSDPSWAWDLALELAELVVASGRHMIFITKAFREAEPETLRRFGELKVEFRVSVSAFDTPGQFAMRHKLLHAARDAGGLGIPQLLSAQFRAAELNRKQDEIVALFQGEDFPASENSLRFVPGSPLLDMIDHDACGHVASTGDLWAGRLYPELVVPTATSVPSEYRGLESRFGSGNDPAHLATLWADPVHTNAEVLSGVTFDKPKQCGVAAHLEITDYEPMLD